MDVVFTARDGGGSVATIDRPDGVRLRMRSYDRTSAIPHDLAHFVAEHAAGLRRGVWGSIAAGAVFASMEVVSGRLRHDRHRRSQAVLRDNADAITWAELIAGVVHDGVGRPEAEVAARLREAWGVTSPEPCPVAASRVVGACAELDRLGRAWAGLPSGGGLALRWTLTASGASSRSRPSRRGRARSR